MAKSTRIEISRLQNGDADSPTLDEFERLKDQEFHRNHFTTIHGDFKETKSSKTKDRVMPYTHSRVKIRNDRKNDSPINASWILQPQDEGHYDSISTLPYLSSSKIGLIVKNTPDELNFESSVQMIYENDVSVALNFPRSLPPPKINNSFWSRPKTAESKLTREFVSRGIVEPNLIREEWDLSMETKALRQTKRLIQFEVKEFSIQSNDAIERILRAVTYVRKEMTIDRQQLILLIQDENNGVSDAAIFVALLILLEEIDEAYLVLRNDKNQDRPFINMFERVNDLRSKRMQMVQTFDEYQFLFRSLVFYAQKKICYDRLLKSKDIVIDDGNNTNLEMSIEEEDDIYLTCPEDLRKALKQNKSGINHPVKRTLTDQANSKITEPAASIDEMNEEYLL